ncbi:hypothetical protein T484DRAFT_1649227 [Baffinella frigidus]|nr:hypothetical protein T484DRAFT_1649227 [Cryptophyta sp. CCMP2293]
MQGQRAPGRIGSFTNLHNQRFWEARQTFGTWRQRRSAKVPLAIPAHPKPETRNPKSETRNSKHETRNTKPVTRSPKPETRNTKPETRNPKSETRNTKPETRNQNPKPTNHATNFRQAQTLPPYAPHPLLARLAWEHEIDLQGNFRAIHICENIYLYVYSPPADFHATITMLQSCFHVHFFGISLARSQICSDSKGGFGFDSRGVSVSIPGGGWFRFQGGLGFRV